MKKPTRILSLVLIVLLLLVFVTASARTRTKPHAAPTVPGEVQVQIFWKKDMGLIPISPGSKEASRSACSAFFIYASTFDMRPGKSEIVAYSQPSTAQPKEEDGYYICGYSMQLDAGAVVGVGMGGADVAPKMSRQSYYWTDQWVGGAKSLPGAGLKRGFQGPSLPFIPAGKRSSYFEFEMVYVSGDIKNPTLDPSSETGPSSILGRAQSFAGVWHAYLGSAVLELILQQTGSQVTGQVKLNSAELGMIRPGKVVGNTLRFTVVRQARPVGNGAYSPEEDVGSGVLVLDAGGTSFTGAIFGVVTRGGALIGR